MSKQETIDLIRRLRERADHLAAMAGEPVEAVRLYRGAADALEQLVGGPEVAASPEPPVVRVRTWLEARFAERPEGWLSSELMHVARNDGVDLCYWYECPEVANIIDRTQHAELWPGRLEPVWRLKTTGEAKP